MNIANSAKSVVGNLQASAGFFFAGVFVESFFPVPGVLLLFSIPYFLLLFAEREIRLRINIYIFPLLGMSIYYWFFMFKAPADIDYSIVKQVLYFYLMLVVFVCGNLQANPLGFLRGFWSGLLPIAAAASLLGVVKVILQEQGYVISGLIDLYNALSIPYPYGSSLRSDYNLFGLGLLVSLVGAIIAFVKAKGYSRYVAVLFMALLLLAIYLVGSRRTYALLIPVVMWGGYVITRCLGRSFFIGYLAGCLLLLWFSVFLGNQILTGNSYSGYQRFPSALIELDAWEVDARSNKDMPGNATLNQSLPSTTDYQGQIITYTPDRLFPTVTSEENFGLASRLDRWSFAVELLRSDGWLWGKGFSYRNVFSCKFVSCAYPDYPHNAFLSEFLVAGILGAMLSSLLAFSLVFVALKSPEQLWLSGAGIIAVIVFPSLLISGDGIFSSSQVLAGFFIMLLFLEGKYCMVFYRKWRAV